MALVSGKLPAGTCYGTPQQLLDIFSQHLSVTGTDQGVLYTLLENTTPFVSDPEQPLPRLWVDLSQGSPLLHAYGGSTSRNWVMVGRQIIQKTFTFTDLNTPTSSRLICNLPARSLIERIGYRVSAAFTTAASVTAGTLIVERDPTSLTSSGTGAQLFTIVPTTAPPNAGTTHIAASPASAASSNTPLIIFPSLPASPGSPAVFGNWSSVTPYKASSIYLFRPATPATFNGGQITFWVEFTQFQA